MNKKATKKKGWISVLMSYAVYCKGKIIISVILSITSIMAGLIPFISIYEILMHFINGTINKDIILSWCAIAALAYIVKQLFFGISTTLSHISAYTILEKLRISVADKFMNAPLGNVMDKPIGEIKNMIVDKIENIEPPLAHMIPEGSGNIVLPVVVFIVLLVLNWKIALASIITIPLSIIPFSIALKSSNKKYGMYMQSSNNVSSAIVEYIEGIQVIKAFGREGSSYEKFEKSILDFKKFVIDWLSSTWVPLKLTFALMPSTLLGGLPMGLYLYTKGEVNPAEVCLYLLLSMSMVGSIAKLEVFTNNLKQMSFAVENAQEFLEMKELSQPTKEVKIRNYDVKFNNVRFGYDDDKQVINNLNLELKDGCFAALVGPSGGGKSTIARLLARFWDVTGGSITIGGTNIKDIPLSQLSSIISFVTQDNFLFNCTILENIRLGNPNATDGEVYAAAHAAQCDEFINKLEKGYDTPAGDAGSRLSGGEKQRIAIARMILKDAPIVILDEATAFTDPENEHKIQKSISVLTNGKTLLVIAHRLSTIKDADKIIVLKNGLIEASGTQDELLDSCSLYRSMWEAHINSKEWSVNKKGVAQSV